jgi:GAF domain-containing protein
VKRVDVDELYDRAGVPAQGVTARGRQADVPLVRATRAFTEAVPDFSHLLETVVRELSAGTGDACTLRLLSDDGRTLTPVASHFGDPEVLASIRSTMEATQRADEGLWSEVVARGKAAQFALPPDGELRQASEAQRAFIDRHRPRHILGIPLLARGHLLGGLALVRFRPQPFGGGEIALLEALGERAALAIDNARLFRAVQTAAAEAEARAAQLERQVRRIQALHTIDLAITASLDLRVALNILLEQILANLEVDAAQVLLVRPASRTLEFGGARGFRTEAGSTVPAAFGVDTASRAALERRTVVSAGDDWIETPARRARFAEEGFAAAFAIPLIARGRVMGVLELFHRSTIDVDADWLGFLEVLAGQAAIAIDSASAHEDLQRSHDELERAYDATLEGWVRALDLRDREVEGHSQRVTAMAVHFARLLGFSDAEVAHVYRGALLHDIGKIAIPDAILRKNGPLDATEWETMRRHPVHAFDWLSPIAYLRPSLAIPHEHHERWDGSGYPRGLKGREISPAARLFAVVDVYDALRSERPYGAAHGVAEARETIRAMAGSHLDPNYVDAFLAVDWEPIVEASAGRGWP